MLRKTCLATISFGFNVEFELAPGVDVLGGDALVCFSQAATETDEENAVWLCTLESKYKKRKGALHTIPEQAISFGPFNIGGWNVKAALIINADNFVRFVVQYSEKALLAQSVRHFFRRSVLITCNQIINLKCPTVEGDSDPEIVGPFLVDFLEPKLNWCLGFCKQCLLKKERQ